MSDAPVEPRVLPDAAARSATPWTIAKFLAGDRRSILALWSDRWTLLVGGILVLAGSLARNYDGHDLIREWHVLLHGFGASIGNALVLYSLFRLAALFPASKTPAGDGAAWPGARSPFWRGYAGFLGVFWMTAPMAWLYGIPYEHLMEPVEAIRANLWTLAAVSVWRVLLISRVLSVAFGLPMLPVLLLTMLFGDVLAFAAVVSAPLPTLDLMGGLRHPPQVQLIASTAFLVGFWGFLTAPVWLIATLIGIKWMKAKAAPPLRTGGPVPWAALALGVGAVAGWLGAAGIAQPPVRLKVDVERRVAQGSYDDAAELLTAHERAEFPPVWDLPPRQVGSKDSWQGPLAGMREAIGRRGEVPAWVGAAYAEKSLYELNTVAHGLSWRMDGEETYGIADLLWYSAPEGYRVADVAEFVAMHADVDDATRARWRNIVSELRAYEAKARATSK